MGDAVMKIRWLAVLAVCCAFAGQAGAAVLIDKSPAATGGGTVGAWLNEADGQNFGMQFTLAVPTILTSIDIYSPQGPTNEVGAATVIKLWEDAGGTADLFSLLQFNSTITAKDGVGTGGTPFFRLESTFTSPLLAAGTYWIGLSGVNDIGWGTVNLGDQSPPGQLQFSGNGSPFQPAVWSFSYRISDNNVNGAVPEPSTWAMIILGFAGMGFMGYRRSRKDEGLAFVKA
jgi:hypothetical protein